MHERVTGLRQTGNNYLIGVDKTQSIALDEIFGRKVVDLNGNERYTKTYRKTRVTEMSMKQVTEIRRTDGSINDGEKQAEQLDTIEEESVVVPVVVTRSKGICSGEIGRTLLIMIIMWCCTSANYMIINIFLKYIPGSEYLNFTIAGFAEIFAHLSVGLIFGKFGVKATFIVGYAIALAGGVCMIFQNQFATNNFLIATFVLLAKFGASMTMCVCQIATPWMFPTTLCGTAFGICNLFGRFTQATAPFIAEFEIPLPMEIFSAFAGIALACSFLIRPAKD